MLHCLVRIQSKDCTLLIKPGRLLRQLAGERLLLNVSRDKFALTPYTKALATEHFASIYNYIWHTNYPVFQNFPKFAKDTGYKNPTSIADSNFAHYAGEGKTVFGFYTENPSYGKDFSDVMTTYAGTKTAWPDLYPSSNILDGAKSDRALVVDQGGSVGHDLLKFYNKNKNVPDGSLILQDLPDIVELAKLESPLTKQGHDFFQPQPVKGARAYYMHCVLHDWPDSECIKILGNLAAAMEKGYSRILIHEIVVKLDDVSRHETFSDLTMMVCLSAVERTEVMWKDLVEKSGLKITKIWTSPESIESVIECELP